MTTGLTLELWTDCAVKYIPLDQVSQEDEVALVQAALAHQGAKLNVEIAQQILMEDGQSLDRPFLPTLWVQEEIKARAEATAALRPTPPVTVEEDVEIEDDPDDE